MRKELSLRQKMILGGIAAVFIPLLIMGSVIYLKLSRSLLDIYKQRSVQIARDASRIIEITLKQEIEFVSAISLEKKIIGLVSEKKYLPAVNRIKSIYKKTHIDYLSILLIDRNGISRADTDSGIVAINVSDRQYFKDAKNGRTGVQGPFLTRHYMKPAFIICRPIIKEKRFIGAVAMAIEMKLLIEMISPLKNGRTGYAFIVDKDGIVIVHPIKEYVFNINMFKEPGMEEFAKQVIKDKTGAGTYNFRGTEKIAGFTAVSLTGWTVAFTQNMEEIMKPVNAILYFILAGTCVFLITVITVIAVFSQKLSTPVQKVIDMLKQLTAHSENAILSIGLDGKIAFANHAAERIFGKSIDELVGSEPELTNLNDISPDEIWKELKNGKTWSGNIIISNKAKEQMTLAVLIIPVIDKSETIRSYLELARDITEETKFQARLIQSEKMEALGAMAGGIAHDFNNVLSGILGYAELSLLTAANPPETEDNLKEIIKAAERVRELVRQILTFSRQDTPELRPLTAGPVVKEAIKLLRASIPAEIELRTAVKSGAMIVGEPIQLHQILVNICVNAVHAIGGRPGAIGIDLEDIAVDPEFAARHPGLKPGNHVLLRITDSGRGIEPEILDRIFEPFFTTKSKGQGTGLGLSVVHGMVKKLNGIITVYSKVGEGTAFNIIIPAADKDAAETGGEISEIPGGSERIMLVDDEKIVIDPMKIILTSLGYKVTAFTESVHALDAFRNNPDEFDIIITDYSMPHMTGIEMIESMKKIRPDIPVIISSGYLSQETNELFARAGVVIILNKPVNTYQLADAIRKAFN